MTISKQDAMTCHTFYHATMRNADGTAVRCRANGKCKVWKTKPDDFRLPVKYGLKQCLYLTPDNAREWMTSDPTVKPEPGTMQVIRRQLTEDARYVEVSSNYTKGAYDCWVQEWSKDPNRHGRDQGHLILFWGPRESTTKRRKFFDRNHGWILFVEVGPLSEPSALDDDFWNRDKRIHIIRRPDPECEAIIKSLVSGGENDAIGLFDRLRDILPEYEEFFELWSLPGLSPQVQPEKHANSKLSTK